MTEVANKKSKLKIAVAVVVVLILIIIALPFLLDIDQFRPQIETKLSDTLGRSVKLGKLSLSIFSGSLSVDDIAIADNPKFSESPFVTAGSFNIGIELKPLLFSKEIHIIGVTLRKPSIYLRRSVTGEWNFSDLGAKDSAAPAATKDTESEPAVSPAGVAGILVDRLEITDGRVEIIEGKKPPSVYEKVNLTVKTLAPAATSPFTLSVTIPGGGALNMDGTFGPINQGDMIKTPVTANLKIARFDLVASGYVPGDTGLAGLLNFDGNLDSDGRTAQSRGKATASNLQMVKGGAKATKPVSLDYSFNYDLGKKTGTLTEAAVAFGAAAMRLNGDFDASGEVPRLNMKLQGNAVPVEELLELLPAFGITLPKGATLEGGTLNTEIAASGTLDNLTMDGNAMVTETHLKGFDLGEKMALVAKIAGLKSSPDTLIEKLGAKMRWTAQGIAVNDIQLVLPALGALSGAGTISPQQELDFAMKATLQPTGGGLATLTGGKALQVGFFINGNADDPKFVPDYKNAARNLLDSVLSGKDSEKSGVTDDLTGKGEALRDSLKGLLNRR